MIFIAGELTQEDDCSEALLGTWNPRIQWRTTV